MHVYALLYLLFYGQCGSRLRYYCLLIHIFSYKHAFHIMATFLSFLEILHAMPQNVSNIAHGILSLITTIEMDAPASFNGHVIERSGWRNLHCIFHVLDERCPSQHVQVMIWQNIVAFLHSHNWPQHTHTHNLHATLITTY